MFGHDNSDQSKHTDDLAMGAPMPPEPPADGSLGDGPSDMGDNSSYGSPDPAPTPPPSDNGGNDMSSGPSPSAGTDDLLDIKQQALQQLSPLVGHLDQTPEEKFRTTMMMIQGSDNQGLIKDAYTAAQQITDEKARAQALLDVVNEINYFTQHSS